MLGKVRVSDLSEAWASDVEDKTLFFEDLTSFCQSFYGECNLLNYCCVLNVKTEFTIGSCLKSQFISLRSSVSVWIRRLCALTYRIFIKWTVIHVQVNRVIPEWMVILILNVLRNSILRVVVIKSSWDSSTTLRVRKPLTFFSRRESICVLSQIIRWKLGVRARVGLMWEQNIVF